MLYNLLFSATFSKDFSHLQGPPESPEWSEFKKSTFAYVIQKHEDSITFSGKKHLFYIHNTSKYMAFGIYTSIHDYAKLGKVNQEYMLRRRGGDHSVHQGDLTKGDYPTEASIGAFWIKKDTSVIKQDSFIDMDIDKLLKIYEQQIPPFWSRPRDAARQDIPDVLESPLKVGSTPTYKIVNIKKIINAINNNKKLLVKTSEKAEINLFYNIVHAVIAGEITADFSFCTAFKSKSFFKGQRVITIGTLRTKGGGAVKASDAINPTPADNLNQATPRTIDPSSQDEDTDLEELELEDEDIDDVEEPISAQVTPVVPVATQQPIKPIVAPQATTQPTTATTTQPTATTVKPPATTTQTTAPQATQATTTVATPNLKPIVPVTPIAPAVTQQPTTPIASQQPIAKPITQPTTTTYPIISTQPQSNQASIKPLSPIVDTAKSATSDKKTATNCDNEFDDNKINTAVAKTQEQLDKADKVAKPQTPNQPMTIDSLRAILKPLNHTSPTQLEQSKPEEVKTPKHKEHKLYDIDTLRAILKPLNKTEQSTTKYTDSSTDNKHKPELENNKPDIKNIELNEDSKIDKAIKQVKNHEPQKNKDTKHNTNDDKNTNDTQDNNAENIDSVDSSKPKKYKKYTPHNIKDKHK